MNHFKNLTFSSKTSLLKIIVTVCWCMLFVLLLRRDLFISTVVPGEVALRQQAEREEYQGVYFRQQKIGYVINHYIPGEGNSLRVDQKAHMNLNVAETVHQIDLHLEAELLADNTLESFTFSFESPFYQMSAKGHVEGSRVLFTLTTGSNTIEDSLDLGVAPIVPTVRRAYLLQSGLEVGDKVKIPWFDPVSLTAKNSVIEYFGKEKLQINGRVNSLHKFIESFGGVRVSLWLSDDGDVVKEESPAGFVFIREPKFRALNLDEASEELLSAVAVQVTGTMPGLEGLSSMQYRLQFPEIEGFVLNSGRQQFDGSILTIQKEDISEDDVPESRSCSGIGNSLAASPYIQSDDEKIVDLATRLLSETESDQERIRKLADWVYHNLEKRPVMGIPDALTTLDSLRGDCNEHAALFAALARSGGIPTRIAAGVVYHKNAFYYHAWNEVCVGDRWLSLDTTTNQLPADLSHIKFVQGELDEQVRIGGLLGKLAITPLLEEHHDTQESGLE